MKKIKYFLKHSPLFKLVEIYKNHAALKKWSAAGKKFPPIPHAYKQLILKKYAAEHRIKTLVETGTYLGDMVWAMRNRFTKIYSIELASELHENARKKFDKFKHIKIIQGDSGEKIAEILKEINIPCLFWLDGHYSSGITAKGSKDTPIAKELQHILNHHIKNHVILIDDAREFIGKNDYPTFDELKKMIIDRDSGYKIDNEYDIIRIYK